MNLKTLAPMQEVRIELRQNERFTAAEVEGLLAKLDPSERRFGEE